MDAVAFRTPRVGTADMKISVIVPVYNEGASVRAAHDEIVRTLRSRTPNLEFEVVFVDDGSDDDTFSHLEGLCRRHRHVRAIRLLGNCGSHMAIRAGLEHARADVACFLACDLQDPPELIPTLLEALRDPVQIVWAVHSARQGRWLSRLLSSTFSALARIVVPSNHPPRGASMFLLGPRALKAVQLHQERNLALGGLCAAMSFKQASVRYERRARLAGTSKWTLTKRLKLFADFFVGYSYAPIRLMSYLGMLVACLGFLYAVLVVVNRTFLSTPIEGWSSLMVVVLLIGGLQMTMMGIMGEYVWRTLDEARARPRYIIETILGDEAGQ
jgi:polyisoprenyl-phosphate glycosyltransferase